MREPGRHASIQEFHAGIIVYVPTFPHAPDEACFAQLQTEIVGQCQLRSLSIAEQKISVA